jgi:ribonuclease T1
MRKLLGLVLVLIVAVTAWQHRAAGPAPRAPDPGTTVATREATPPTFAVPAGLPPEAAQTLARIADGGPFPHPQDGTMFGNYEGRLPPQPRGYYHEYTVDTPGAHTRGTRRIITGGSPPEVYYYTGDHYRSFRRIEVPR